MTYIMTVLPDEKKRPVDDTKNQIDFECIVECSFNKISMIYEIDYWLSEQKY